MGPHLSLHTGERPATRSSLRGTGLHVGREPSSFLLAQEFLGASICDRYTGPLSPLLPGLSPPGPPARTPARIAPGTPRLGAPCAAPGGRQGARRPATRAHVARMRTASRPSPPRLRESGSHLPRGPTGAAPAVGAVRERPDCGRGCRPPRAGLRPQGGRTGSRPPHVLPCPPGWRRAGSGAARPVVQGPAARWWRAAPVGVHSGGLVAAAAGGGRGTGPNAAAVRRNRVGGGAGGPRKSGCWGRPAGGKGALPAAGGRGRACVAALPARGSSPWRAGGRGKRERRGGAGRREGRCAEGRGRV